jgi:preprotein translocase subunit SecB
MNKHYKYKGYNMSATESPATQPEFAIQRLYVKDLSLETPNCPQIFLEPWEPEMHMDIATDSSLVLEKEVREVVLKITLTVKLKTRVAFLVEVKQAGIFALKGFAEDQLSHMLGSFCPSLLYPYAREVVTSVVMRAGFPQLYLAPVNFDALFAQHQKTPPETDATTVNQHSEH